MLVLGCKQEKNAAGASRVFDDILWRRLQVFDLLPMERRLKRPRR
jgi:hypothetical protein